MPLSKSNYHASPASVSTPSFGRLDAPTSKQMVRQRSDTSKGGSGKTSKWSFPWGRDRSEPKEKRGGPTLVSPMLISHPLPSPNNPVLSTLYPTAQSLPTGFPLPRTQVVSSVGRVPLRPPPPPPRSDIHPPSSYNNHRNLPRAHAFSGQAFTRFPVSVSSDTMSTMPSSSSFASTFLFSDDWDSSSEATSMSLSSSPESSAKEGQTQRMWKVEGLVNASLHTRVPREGEAGDDVISRWRNSTPIPGATSALLAGPSTPPRLKRLSDSSTTPSPASPPFNPLSEKAVRNQAAREISSFTPSPPASPESSGDADDEVSPPRTKTAGVLADFLLPSIHNPKTRIPTIRFEGISMDAVFAEVEQKMKFEGSEALERKAKRRTRVLSMYPTCELVEDQIDQREPPPLPSLPTSSSTSSILEITHTSAKPLSSAGLHPQRKIASRPTPLNIIAANGGSSSSLPTRTASTTFPVMSSPVESSHRFNSRSESSGGHFSPRLISSPTLSPRFATSPTLGDAFTITSIPSPALSSTSSFRGYDLPEVCVRPPTPTEDEVAHKSGGGTVVLEEKRRIRISTRAAPGRRPQGRVLAFAEGDVRTPPLSPAVSTASTISSNGALGSPVLEGLGLFPMTTPVIFGPTSISEDDATDVEDALNNMLLRLNQPTSFIQSERLSLTREALSLHTAAYEDASETESDLDPFPNVDRSRFPTDQSTVLLDAMLATSALGITTSVSATSLPYNRDSLDWSERVYVTSPTPSNSESTLVDSATSNVALLSGSHSMDTDETNTDSELDGYDSTGFGELGVVMMGERVKIGCAM